MERDERYEEAKRLARTGETADRARLAARADTAPELLFFLAGDPDPEVRRAVAANSATPPQADTVLARDRNFDVRCALARKVVGDGLADEARRSLWRMSFTLLEMLAVDRVVRVRRILSRALAFDREAPHPVVVKLAGDAEREVAEPVLKNSPVLTDGDLVAIVERGAPDWAHNAIAGRPDVSPAVTAAIARTPALASAPAAAAKRRSVPQRFKGKETPEGRALRLLRDGALNDEVISLALTAGERDFVTAALALRAEMPLSAGRRIVASKSPRAVTALAWKGKFPMRFAVDVQRRLAGIAPNALIYARNGVDYPLTPKEMNWHLGLFAD